MRVKVSLHRPGGRVDDVLVTADATASVGHVADAVARCDPHGRALPVPGTLTLGLARPGTGWVALSRATGLSDSGIRSGAALALLPASDADDAGRGGAAAATLTVVSGPGSGSRFELPAGTSVIGRDRSCDVRLVDPLVSKQHARITVADVVELVDLNSSNGVDVNGSRCRRAVIGSQDVVVLGDTGIQVALHVASAATGEAASGLGFNRSPLLLARPDGVHVPLPEPPERAPRTRFPMIPMLAPLVLAAVLLAVTRSPTAILFAALSPVMLAGQWLEMRISGRRDFADAGRQFTASLAAAQHDIGQVLAAEVTQRGREHPSTAEVVAAVNSRSPLLWSRRPDAAGFLELRFGTGRCPARTQIDLPRAERTTAEFRDQLAAVAASARTVAPVPVVGSFPVHGALGIAGPIAVALPMARALVAGLLGLHSPAEVVLAAVTDPHGALRWSWLRWAPHTSSEHSPLAGPHLASDGAAARDLVAGLEEVVAQRTTAGADRSAAPGPVVVLLVEDGAPVDRARLVWLAEHGPAGGVHVLWLSGTVDQLPAACRAYLAVAADGTGAQVGYVTTGETVQPVATEALSDRDIDAFANALAPIVDAGARMDDETDLPRSVSLLTLAGADLADDAGRVVDRWAESGSLHGVGDAAAARRSSLGAVVGQAGNEPFYLDLRTQGPHALVGGTTGAGKSEFLQSWVLGLATTYSPQRVTFLFVDYKGGSAFGECTFLPHCVGMVTDLSAHLFTRTLASLRAELTYRERILERKRAKDLLELERRRDPEAPPSLVIVVDEFAALVSEVPGFVDGMVDIAQRGRSLGLHLILATQRPAGVIKDNLRANTNLRVALRMADESDSTDVLGTTQAAAIEPALPGRGFAKTGPGRLTPFQSGYVGGRTSTTPAAPSVAIEELAFGVGTRWDEPEPLDRGDPASAGPTDMQRLVATIEEAAKQAGIEPVRRPWLDPLSPVFRLDQLPGLRTDSQLVFGVLDNPRHQEQRAVAFLPDKDGNLAVYGTGGSGKSALLRTLAVAAGITPRGGPCQVYGLDFATRGLSMLEPLPHVGSIISGDDPERAFRLMRWLRELIDERARRYAAANAGSITEYRTRAGMPDEARILLLVDGVASFRQLHDAPGTGLWEQFLGVAADGRPVGVHVVVSADRVLAIPSALASVIQKRLVLRMADPEEYRSFGIPVDAISTEAPPGRGFWEGDEVQIAVPGGHPNVAEQSRTILGIADAIRRAGSRPADPIRRLEERIPLSALAATDGSGLPVIGVADETLAPVAVDLAGTFLIAGPPFSGRTTALLTVALAAHRSGSHPRLIYVGPGRDRNLALVPWDRTVTGPDDTAQIAREIAADLARAGGPRTMVVLDAASEALGGPADGALLELATACTRYGHAFVADGESSAITSSYSDLAKTLKSGRAGLLLRPQQSDGEGLLKTALPRISKMDFPPGRGFVITRGRSIALQVALPEEEA